jgi:hypothetical protein
VSYAPLSSLKDRLQDASTVDDALLQASLDWADQFINAWCDRVFSAVAATRYYVPQDLGWEETDPLLPASSGYRSLYLPYKRLYLNYDVLTVTAVTNGDGTSIPADGTGFFLEPFNAASERRPFSSLYLLSAYSWTWNTDGRVAVTGTWGFSALPDALIVNTALLLAEWHYRARAPQTVVTIFSNKSKPTKLEGFPQGVLDVLDTRKRQAA